MQLDENEDSEFVKFWNTVLEPKFTRFRHILEGGLSRYSSNILPTLGIKGGMSVLDVGCGWGDMAIDISKIVVPKGLVVGIDCVEEFLSVARRDAKKMEIDNVFFLQGDAEKSLPEREFDYVVARFGTMFFTNPVAALRNIRFALKPGGQFTHIVWRNRSDCPAVEEARNIALKYLPYSSKEGENCGPGPFSMANQDITTAMMKSAGFTNISFERMDEKIMVGSDVEEAIEFALSIGPAGEIIREANEHCSKEKRTKIKNEMRSYFGTAEHDTKGIWMPMSAWVISSTNPGFENAS